MPLEISVKRNFAWNNSRRHIGVFMMNVDRFFKALLFPALTLLLNAQFVWGAQHPVFTPAKFITCHGRIDPSDMNTYNVPSTLNSKVYFMMENVMEEPGSSGGRLSSSLAAYLHGSLSIDLQGLNTRFGVSTKVKNDSERIQYYHTSISAKPIPLVGSNTQVDQLFLEILTGKGTQVREGKGYLKLGAGQLGAGGSFRVFYQLTCKLS